MPYLASRKPAPAPEPIPVTKRYRVALISVTMMVGIVAVTYVGTALITQSWG
ncbi:hypothetical protein FHW37_12511 [Neorhizobium alkalisoli]|jgi:hypothetical protein|uniref:Uncharacterized protein n=1 Tax=Neorhizobium alkalisoli TaxID=528178 RepID=A0A561PUT3_9HYPH|nr:hypothetical protein FHW37_12511 [Neorhizobium alkalisoli]